MRNRTWAGRLGGTLRRSWLSLGAVLLALLLMGGAVAGSVAFTLGQRGTGYDAIWLLPAGSGRVRVGVTSHQSVRLAAGVSLAVNGVVVKVWPSVPLAPGATWSQFIEVPPKPQAASVTAKLFQVGHRSTSQSVYLN
jgi:hypothetical protein